MGEAAECNGDCRDEPTPALKAREQVLKEHPDLQTFQDEIDRVLAGAFGHEDRMMSLALLIVLRNMDSLLERDDFDRAEYFPKRHAYLAEIHALHRKTEDARKELDELRKRNSDEADFAKFVSEADAFKAVTHTIMNLPLPDKQRLLRGVVDGPIVVGHSTL